LLAWLVWAICATLPGSGSEGRLLDRLWSTAGLLLSVCDAFFIAKAFHAKPACETCAKFVAAAVHQAIMLLYHFDRTNFLGFSLLPFGVGISSSISIGCRVDEMRDLMHILHIRELLRGGASMFVNPHQVKQMIGNVWLATHIAHCSCFQACLL